MAEQNESYKNQYQDLMELRPIEVALKSLYEQFGERRLDEPHNADEVIDIVNLANTMLPEPDLVFLEKFSNSKLNEELYISNDFDVEIHHRIRYLPTTLHSANFIETACILNGECTGYIAGNKIPLHTGDICIISPNTTNAISVFSDDSLIINFDIRRSTFEKSFLDVLSGNDTLSDFFMRSLYQNSYQPYLLFRTGEDEELSKIINFSLREFQQDYLYKNKMLNILMNALFITLLRNHLSDIVIPELESPQENENATRILEYLQEHYKSVSLTEIASHFNYSERQIQRIIKDSTGVSFQKNVQRLKLRQALDLIQYSHLSVARIAEELGYSSADNFRRNFKNYFGKTPMAYRNSETC